MEKLDKKKLLIHMTIGELLELISSQENKQLPKDDKIFTVKTLAMYLSASEVFIRKNLRKLPHMRPKGTRRILFRKEAIDAWLDDNSSESYSELKMRLNAKLKSRT